jgi:hypothetical protein
VDFLEWFPGVTRAQVDAVLEHASQSLALPARSPRRMPSGVERGVPGSGASTRSWPGHGDSRLRVAQRATATGISS